MWFAAPQSGTWAGFDAGDVSFGDVIFGNVPGVLLGATGEVTRDLSNPAILAPAAANNRPAAANNRPAYPRHIRRRSRALDLGDDAARPRGPRARGERPSCDRFPRRKSLGRSAGGRGGHPAMDFPP